MILVDTNILSTFGKVGRIKLLFDLFQTKLSVSSNVFYEISIAYEKGYFFAESVLDCIKNEKIDVVAVNQDDLPYMLGLPKSFGPGERDSIAMCKSRGYVFLSNEKKVYNYCKKHGIQCLLLPHILKSLWKENILDKEDVEELITEMESSDNIVIVNKDSIFS